MIKGVNRQVIEITQTDCEYFERILFLVKPECAAVSEGKLRERAREMSSAGKPPATQIRHRMRTAALMAGAACCGAALAWLIQFLLR